MCCLSMGIAATESVHKAPHNEGDTKVPECIGGYPGRLLRDLEKERAEEDSRL